MVEGVHSTVQLVILKVQCSCEGFFYFKSIFFWVTLCDFEGSADVLEKSHSEKKKKKGRG